MNWNRYFYAAFIAVLIFPAITFAWNERVPVDADEPVEEDGEPDDMSTPLGEIKNVVDALGLLNTAVKTIDGKFVALEAKIDSIDALKCVSPEEFSAFTASVKADMDAVKATVGTLPNEIPSFDLTQITESQDAIWQALETKIDSTQNGLGTVVQNVEETKEQLKNVETSVGKTTTPFATFFGGLNAVATWIAATFASFRTLYFLVGWFKKRGSNRIKEFEAKLQALQAATQSTATIRTNDTTNLF